MNPHSLVENTHTIFSLSDVALRINELINADDASNIELGKVVLYDPALTTRVLKFANSSYFGFSKKIDTVSHAISLIGRRELHNLVMAMSVTATFEGISSDLIDMEAFWFQSVACGTAAKLYATYNKSEAQERFFISGLLHAIGRLILINQCPKEAAETLRFKDQGADSVINAEREIFGFTYAEVSAALLKQWNLPPSIWKVVEFHLDPLNVDEYTEEACILHAAVNLANCMQYNMSQNINFDEIMPVNKEKVWDYLGFDPEINKTICEKSLPQIFDILNIVRPQAIMVR